MKKIVNILLISCFYFLSLTNLNAGCPCDISTTQNKIEQDIEDYVSENVDALEELNKQLKKDLKEIKNRTDNIQNEDYLNDLKNKIEVINNSKNIKKNRLLDYRNKLYFSKNGIILKTDELLKMYSLVKSLEDVENSLNLVKGYKK